MEIPRLLVSLPIRKTGPEEQGKAAVPPGWMKLVRLDREGGAVSRLLGCVFQHSWGTDFSCLLWPIAKRARAEK